MKYRLWYAQLDLFDTVRRFVLLAAEWPSATPLSKERLFISDFYLASPPLLHWTRMTLHAREAFRALDIPRPEAAFLNYPSPPILFEKMSGIQSEALHNLVGRGLVDLVKFEHDEILLSSAGEEFVKRLEAFGRMEAESAVLKFLREQFSQVGRDVGGLRAATGLRRIGA